MVVEVEFSDKDGYILATLNGMSTISDIVSAFTRVFSYSSRKNVSKMIVDCRGIENSMPLEDIARVSEKFNNIQDEYEENSQNKLTFAFLLNDELYDPEKLNAQINQGKEMPTFVGSDPDAAEKWLLSRVD